MGLRKLRRILRTAGVRILQRQLIETTAEAMSSAPLVEEEVPTVQEAKPTAVKTAETSETTSEGDLPEVPSPPSIVPNVPDLTATEVEEILPIEVGGGKDVVAELLYTLPEDIATTVPAEWKPPSFESVDERYPLIPPHAYAHVFWNDEAKKIEDYLKGIGAQ